MNQTQFFKMNLNSVLKFKMKSFFFAAVLASNLAAAAEDVNKPAEVNPSVDLQTYQDLVTDSRFKVLAQKLGRMAAKKQKEISDKISELVEKARSAGHKEINRYNLNLTFDLDGNKITAFNKKLSFKAIYQVQIRPNFDDGEQVRRDIFTVGLGSEFKRLGADVKLRFTFSRTFGGENAKWTALTDWNFPYLSFWTKVPMEADDFKTKMADGEMVRVEILGRANVGVGKSVTEKFLLAGVSAQVYTEALFSIDAQRVPKKFFADKNIRARLRFLGLKNSASAEGGINVGTTELASHFDNWLKNLFSIGASISLSSSLPLREKLPIDSLMVDYLFRFETADEGNPNPDSAEAAVNEIYQNILNFGFLDLIDPRVPSEKVSEKMLSHASKAEEFARADAHLKLGDQARVRHLFKGRLTSKLKKTVSSGQITRFINGDYQVGSINSFVRSQDVNGNKTYYLLDNAFTRMSKRTGVWDRNYIERIDDFDFLIQSDAKEKVGPLLDIVTRTEIKDKNFTSEKIAQIRDSLLASLPATLVDKERISNFFPTTDQTDAYFAMQFNYGADAVRAIGSKVSSDEITLKTYQYILENPRRDAMRLPFDTAHGDVTPPSYSEYIGPIAKEIAIALGGASVSNEDRLEAFRNLKEQPLFQEWLILEFLPRLIPVETAGKTMKLSLKFNSTEEKNKKPLFLGESQVSSVYNSVVFLRSVINGFDSFDMRLEKGTDDQGREIIHIQQLGDFSIEESDGDPGPEPKAAKTQN